MKFLPLALFMICIFSAHIALACSCRPISAEEAQKIFDDAYFVGKVKFSNVKYIDNNNPNSSTTADLEILESYNDNFQGSLSVVLNHKEGMCIFGHVNDGDIKEVIVQAIEDEIFHFKIKGQCPYIQKEHWQPLIDKAAKKNADLKKAQNDCEAQNGTWGIAGLFQEPICIYPAKDAGKSCQDGTECEGDCIADLTEEQKELLTRADPPFHIKVEGKCSDKIQMFGCFPFVEKGYLETYLCID